MQPTTKSLIAAVAALMLALPSMGCPSENSGTSKEGDKTEGKEAAPKSPENVPKELKVKDVRDKATVVMPSPDQFLTVMAILGKPKWDDLVAPIEKDSFDSKTQTAIVSGIVLAHFFVHVHAKDAKKAEKALDSLIKMTKALDIKTPEEEIKKVKKRLKKSQWPQLRQDFLDMNTELQNDLIKTQKKPDLAMLISLGAYLEGANLGAKLIYDDYSKERAELLRQGDLLNEVERSTKATLNDGDKHVGLMLKNLSKLQKIMDVKADDAISKEKAKEIHELASETKTKLLES